MAGKADTITPSCVGARDELGKIQIDLKFMSKSKVRVDENKENKSSSSTLIDPKNNF